MRRIAASATFGSSAGASVCRVDAAALDVQRRGPVDEHDVGARGALEGSPIRLAPAWPRQRGPVRVGRVRGGQHVDRPLAVAARRLAARLAIDRAPRPGRTGPRPGHPRSSRAGCGRPPPSPAGSGRPPRTRRPSLRRRPPRGSRRRGGRAARWPWHAAVPCRDRRGAVIGATSDHRPAPSGGPRVVSRPTRGRRAASCPPPRCAGRFQRSARSEANVSLVTSPAHTRSHRASSTGRSAPPPGGGVDLAIEHGAALTEDLADPFVALIRRPDDAIGRGRVGRSASRPGRNRASRPSSRPRLPRPTQATSPIAPSSSRRRGW